MSCTTTFEYEVFGPVQVNTTRTLLSKYLAVSKVAVEGKPLLSTANMAKDGKAPLSTANEYASMVDGRGFAEHALKLKELQTDSLLLPEGAEAPTDMAMEWAQLVFDQLIRAELLPTKVVASAEGGVAYCFVAGDKYADIECLNSGALLGVTTNKRDRPFVWEIDPSANGIVRACETVEQFLSAPPSKQTDKKWAWLRRRV